MKQKLFTKVILTVVIVCLLLTVLHLIYDIYAYNHCSIIYFISKELW